MKWSKLLLIVGAIVLIGVYFAFDLGQYLSLAALKERQAAIATFRAERPWTTLAVYFTIYVLVAALSLPGATLLTLAGGAIFGLGWGTVIVSFASSCGATLAFLFARFLLRDWVQSRFAQRLAAVDAGVRREGAFYLFTLRLVPLFPFFLVNLLLGLTAMKTWIFYLVSQIGMLAGTVVYVNAGTQLASIDSLAGVLSPSLLASFAVLGIFPWLARKVVDGIRARHAYAGWRKPARFDRNLLVIGGGSAGLVAAYIAAALKAKVTLIEKDRLGGDCLNTGCVPSKALLRSAKRLSEIARASELGIASAQARFSFAEVMQRVQAVIAQVAPHDSAERYRGLGVEVIRGTAKLVSPWEVDILADDGGTRRLSSRAIVIAAGARPTVPPIPGLDTVGYLTSDTIWELRDLPQRLLVLGGGPIGAELAQAFTRFGAAVTVVDMAPRLLDREDEEVSERVMAGFRTEGIDLRVTHRALRFAVEAGEKVFYADHQGQVVRLVFDTLLLAVGRSANLRGYGLEELGLAGTRTVDTNEFLQTRYPNLYAAGDVVGPFQFTHVAAHQAWYAAVNALFDPFRKFKVDYSTIPRATFVDPEVARVGLNEIEAREQGIPYEVTTYGIDDLDRAIVDGEAEGLVKVLTVPGSDRLLGVTIVGAHAAELLAEFVLAMKHGIGLNKILSTIHIYPTWAEANKYVAGNWKRAHAPQKLLAWVERFHAWRLR
ncbi:MAG TPA: FAD-dependent oxidoreductase [Accumulibacter sp.]|nr:FAD-dependent oxidoreductase [Accumulibacter sp.]HMW18438.1 FAD-dependent oxidoreductase [Accumulibacter sp.]HMX22106.1 FAD-dependent oxidoreductase [Accumulibacter sp.]HMY06364.1 FAD-dependent oxidoreductase [Accumulibacter sp.]HNC18620.1 FAD-dependent oxidoreductase [Accumulibacter sp.]